MFRDSYPKLFYYLSVFTIDSQLDVNQMRSIVARGKKNDPQLAKEIIDATHDESICWHELLKAPEIGDVLDTESEELAYDYFRSIFCE